VCDALAWINNVTPHCRACTRFEDFNTRLSTSTSLGSASRETRSCAAAWRPTRIRVRWSAWGDASD